MKDMATTPVYNKLNGRKIAVNTKYCNFKSGTIEICQYKNGRVAMRIFDELSDPIITPTINVVDWDPPTDRHVCIKNYSENEGILECLIKEEIIKPTGRRIPVAFTYVEEAELII